ncbi:GroES-like protein [Suillus americanus]|nr:GroES-like protein [Suillus americanus]
MQAAANILQSLPTVVQPEYKHREDGSTMKALAWFGATDVRVIDAPIPDITEPDDVIVKVAGTTICGSDLHLYHGEIIALQKGDILGHEFMGAVDRIGPNVKNNALSPPSKSHAETCRYCKEGLSSFYDNTNNSTLQNYMYGTRDAGFFGYSHFTGGFPGGQAEYVRVPLGEVNFLPISNGISDEEALYLSDVLPTNQISGCLERARGQGCEVISSGVVRGVSQKIHEMVPGGLDVALDCGTFHEPKTLLHKGTKTLMPETDIPETANEMIVSVRKIGQCGLFAAYTGFTNCFNIGALMEKGVRFIGNGQAPVHKCWREILYDYIVTGKFDPKFTISHCVSVERRMPPLTNVQDRTGGVEKVFIETRFSSPPSDGAPKLSRVDDWAR